jgi:hypothetical protein
MTIDDPGLSRGSGRPESAKKGLTRRELLTGAAGVAGAVALGSPFLAACGGGGGSTSPSPTASASAADKDLSL